MCRPKGYGLKSGIAFHGAKRVYNRICHFHLRMNKKERIQKG